MELLVTYHLKKESAEEFLRKLGEIGIPGLVRGERGCIRYDYYVPAEENGTLLLLEEWESAPDYVAHTEVMVIRQRLSDGRGRFRTGSDGR